MISYHETKSKHMWRSKSFQFNLHLTISDTVIHKYKDETYGKKLNVLLHN